MALPFIPYRVGEKSKVPKWKKDEALNLLSRFADWKTCQSAQLNPNPEVRDQAITYLREFAADGDPFSQALLENREIP